jgi:hypothetical protein
MPPESYWNGSREDSLAIQDSIRTMRSRPETYWLFNADYVLEKDFVSFTITDSAIKRALRDTFSEDFFPVAFQKVATEVDTVDSLVFAKDSTCTVSLILKIKKGELRVRCDSVTPWKRDTIFGENLTHIYANYFVAKETTLVKELHGESWRSAFFDYDTVSHGWQFKKISGGLQFSFPDLATAPFIYPSIIFAKKITADTVYLRPDSLHHGIQWFYPVDSILTYKAGDTLTLGAYTAYAYADSVPFLWVDSTRSASNTRIFLTNPGFHMISFEIANAEPFISPKATAVYRSILWGIPVLVK